MCLGVVPVKSGLNRVSDRLPVRGDEGDGLGGAGIPTIPENLEAFRWVYLINKKGAIFENPGVMDRARVANKYVQKLALVVTHSLKLNGIK